MGSTFIKAQDLLGGELIFDFIDRPSHWDLDVYINAIGAVWDDNHHLNDTLQGGSIYYNENGPFPNQSPGHASDACWHYQGYDPPLGLGLYLITVAQSDQESENSVSFYFDWRTSHLPPAPGGPWKDQRFVYKINNNDIYRYLDQNEISIDGEVLKIWDEIEDLDHITSGLELYLTVSNQNNNPYLVWNAYHDENIDGYNVYRKVTTSSGTTTYVEFTTNTYYLDEEFYIDPPKTPGDDEVEYWIKAKISSTEESLEGNHVQIIGTSIIQWKNSDKESNDGSIL